MTIRRAVTVLFLLLTPTLSAATFTVTNNYYTGAGSLTEAILSANATPGVDQIRFAVEFVQVDGSHINGAFPHITDPVDIDGTIPSGRVVLSQSAGNSNLLFDTGSSGSTVRMLEFDGNPSILVGGGVTGVTITSTRINGHLFIIGNDNVVGGPAVADRNVISRIDVAAGTGNQVINTEACSCICSTLRTRASATRASETGSATCT